MVTIGRSINANAIQRPGTFVSQRGIASAAIPIANHAVGYLFGTVENDIRDLRYSPLRPYEPVQISSVNDFIEKIGGVPESSASARITYDAVNAYFNNVGNNGILYFTRVTPTPEVVLEVPLSVSPGYNVVTLKINEVEYGATLDPVLNKNIIKSSGIDAFDVAYDIYAYLLGNDEFTTLFNVEELTPNSAKNRLVRLTSKDPTVRIRVQDFKVYNSTDLLNSEIDLLPYVRNYLPSKNLNFRLKTDIADNIKFVDGVALLQYANSNSLPFSDAPEALALLNSYLQANGIIPLVGDYIPVSYSGNATLDGELQGWNLIDLVSSGAITALDTNQLAPAQAVNSIQIFYLEIAGESQAIILNGGSLVEYAEIITNAVIDALDKEDLAKYYDLSASVVQPISSPSLKPLLNPVLTEYILTGTVGLAGTALTGSGTSFLTELFPGAYIHINGKRYTVNAISSETAATVTQAGTEPAGSSAYLDKSEATGFYTFNPVIKLNIKSKNGTIPPVFPGVDRAGDIDTNIVFTSAEDENLRYAEDKYFEDNKVKAQDFAYAILNAFNSTSALKPGFIFAPEAYASLISRPGGVISRTDAIIERLKVTAAIAIAAEGKANASDFDAASQHVGLIDCGGDCEYLTDARDELLRIRRTIGSAFGHLAYFAPYVQNIAGNYVPLSPYVAGIACSRYINEGFQQPPAGVRYPLRDAIGLKFQINSQQQETTYALGLNPAREMPNRGIVIWGSRTMSGDANFKFINTRVILNVLIDVLNRAFDDILFEQIDSPSTVFGRVISIATSVCHEFFRQGALFGNKPEEAYAINCSFSNNSLVAMENGTIVADIYVATSPTLERVLVSVAKTPAGQVALINESFSRNSVRFTNAQISI